MNARAVSNAGIKAAAVVAAALVVGRAGVRFPYRSPACDTLCAPAWLRILRAQGRRRRSPRAAGENLAAAGRIARAGGIDGAGDRDEIDFGNAGGVHGIELFATERLQNVDRSGRWFFAGTRCPPCADRPSPESALRRVWKAVRRRRLDWCCPGWRRPGRRWSPV